VSTTQQHIDQQNSEFWNELCGTVEARKLGITDSSPHSLAKFDAWYLGYYPYLLPAVRPERMRGKAVLEVGLGYGTLGQVLATAGTDYTGMDLARKPVDHMNYRLRIGNLSGRAVQGSALAMPFADQSFDFVVSIGCMHHTGNVQRCFDETFRVLKPGGVATLMVYNRFSWMRWRRAPMATFRDAFAARRSKGLAGAQARFDYDSDTNGNAAPETAVLSVAEIERMLASFESVACTKRNANPLVIKGITLIPRSWLLPTLGRWLGLDIYVEARKGQSQATSLRASA
jgi:SAM-dependent methyltransferase